MDLAGTTVTTDFLCLSFHLEIMEGAINWMPGLCWVLGDTTAKSTAGRHVMPTGSVASRCPALGEVETRAVFSLISTMQMFGPHTADICMIH